MAKDYNEEEVLSVIRNTLRSDCIRLAAKTAPTDDLGAILELKSMAALKRMARAHSIARFSTMDKASLVAALIQAIPDVQRLAEILSIVHDFEWKFFSSAALEHPSHSQPSLPEAFCHLQEMGYIQAFYHEDRLSCVVPYSVRTAYSQLVEAGYPETRERASLLRDYAQAAVSLYGIIRQTELIELFNSQNDRHTDVEELFETLVDYVYLREGFCFWKEWLVDDSFEEDDFAGVEVLADHAEGKPRYVPPKEELLRYTDPEYIETTPQSQALTDFLVQRMKLDKSLAEDYTEELLLRVRLSAPPKEAFELLEEYGIMLADMPQTQAFFDAVVKAYNNTRMWDNKGFTPMEIAAQWGGAAGKSMPRRVQKIGRNQPCPCGSGKKYKHCCGNNVIRFPN